jgi:hypothetical protein
VLLLRLDINSELLNKTQKFSGNYFSFDKTQKSVMHDIAERKRVLESERSNLNLFHIKFMVLYKSLRISETHVKGR